MQTEDYSDWESVPNHNPYCYYLHLKDPLDESHVKKFLQQKHKSITVVSSDSIELDNASILQINTDSDEGVIISQADFLKLPTAQESWNAFLDRVKQVKIESIHKADAFQFELVTKLCVRFEGESADTIIWKEHFLACPGAKDAWKEFVTRKFPKRDFLKSYEKEIQQFWNDQKLFEVDAVEGAPKWMGTFPYPYMNGALHMGHAFTTCKVDFAAGYQRLKGKRALFPYAFHCTGMPIKACADKLKREIETFGNPPVFPSSEATQSEKQGDASKSRKAKVQAKGTGAKYQWQIMQSSGVPESEIANFADAHYWLKYFPTRGMADLKLLGTKIDWRRSFITTDVNKYYDAFIRWQFNKLKQLGKIKFGKRETIYSPLDGQPCMDHDRQTGEGVGVSEYTIIKQQLNKPYPSVLSFLENTDKKVYLAPATLRPETMYGQTNCWILPNGDYGAFEISETEVFICTARAAKNLAFQGYSLEPGKVKELATFKGSELIGAAVSAPLSKYPVIYVWPMFTISVEKTTGVVTSVPSDSPDDYAAFRDLKSKAQLREKYNLKDEMVIPYEVVPIIDVPEYGTTAAITVVDQLKIKSQNDSQQLAKAKEMVYLKGFYEGVMLVGDYAGKKVQEAKVLIKEDLKKAGLAIRYFEPESLVVSRSGDTCVVALCDQWYLDYGEKEWQKQAYECLEQMETYNKEVENQFRSALGWMHEWACSRSYGLGSRIPWDPDYLIESLSDSTIYNAYYTIAHLLQGGIVDGSVEGPAHIKPEQLTDSVFDYIFQDAEFPKDTTIPKATLDELRKEFRCWYPVDLRASGKDLIPNHLLFYIYNHTAIFPKDKWPKGVKANGWLLLNGEKMAKRTGNFITLADAVERYGTDAMRFAFAQAGDGMTDPNFTVENVDTAILQLHTFIDWIKEMLNSKDTMRSGPPSTFWERVFDSQIQKAARLCDKSYEQLLFRDAVNIGFFEIQKARDEYRKAVSATPGDKLNSDLIEKFIRTVVIMMAPIVSYTSEFIWRNILGEKDSIFNARFPTYDNVDESVLAANIYLNNSITNFRNKIHLHTKPPKKADQQKKPYPKVARIYVTPDYPQWHQDTLKLVKELYEKNNNTLPDQKSIAEAIKAVAALQPHMKKIMPTINNLIQKAKNQGITEEDFLITMPFNEVQVLTDTMEYVKSELKLEKIEIYLTTDANTPEKAASLAPGAPGKPLIFFD